MLVVNTVLACAWALGIGVKLLVNKLESNAGGALKQQRHSKVDKSLVATLLDDSEIELRRVRRLAPGPQQHEAAVQLRQQYDPNSQQQQQDKFNVGRAELEAYAQVYGHVCKRTEEFLQTVETGEQTPTVAPALA